MNLDELCRQLPGKKRTVDDVARYVKTRTDDNPNYSLLLGAGCSITSGIRSAGALISEWRREICSSLTGGEAVAKGSEQDQRDFLRAKHSDWYNSSKEYACLFERRYDLQRQRRMFVESEVSKGFPSIGYAYLTALVGQSYFRNIFTTNFDDLLNEAFYLYSSERPIVCAQDSSINSITVTSKRPKIIKLHGDYLFDDIKTTLRETESLEQNMKAKFVEFAKEAGIIVVGYSGSDRSIMDVFDNILKREEYLRAGVYWCLRRDSEIPEELRRLFWKDRVYYIEIDGFDELFGDLYSRLNAGDVLPDSAITTAKRPNVLAERLVNSATAIPETTEVLRQAKDKLCKQLKRSAIANLLVKSEREEQSGLQERFQELTDDELLVLTEADNLISDEKYVQAIEKIRAALAACPRPYFKKRLLKIQIPALRLMNDQAGALQVVEQLISLNGNEASIYLQKARIVSERTRKIAAIDKAMEVEPFSAAAVFARARSYVETAEDKYASDRQADLEAATSLLEKCLELDPSIRNPAWIELFNVIRQIEKNESKCDARGRELLSRVERQNPDSYVALTVLVDLAVSAKREADYDVALQRIASVEKRYGLEECLWVVPLEMKLHAARRDDAKIRNRTDELLRIDLISRETDVAVQVARIVRGQLGDEELAEKILTDALRERDFDPDVLLALFRLLLDLRRIPEATELLGHWGNKVIDRIRHDMRCDLLEATGDFEEGIRLVREWRTNTESNDYVSELYFLICAKKFSEVEKLARQHLEQIHFSPDAVQEIVNFEIARKALGKKVDTHRLEKALKFAGDKIVESGIYALLDRKSEMLAAMREAIKTNKTDRYFVRRWPVFEGVQSDKDVLQILEPSEPRISLVQEPRAERALAV